MRKLALSIGIISVFVGCKSAQKTPVKTQADSAFDQDDDGAIDVPKELQEKTALTQGPSLLSRTRLTRENLSKDLNAGARLAIRVRGATTLQLDIYARNPLDKLTLNVEGSRLKTLDLKTAMSSLQIPLLSLGEETVQVLVPEGKDFGLQITQLVPSEGGEILSWKISDR